MKLLPEQGNINKAEMVNQAEVNQHIVNWSIKNMHKGHTLWEINLDTGETTAAKYDDGTDVMYITNEVRKRVRQNKNCVYIPALKKLGAINKFAKQAQKLL